MTKYVRITRMTQSEALEILKSGHNAYVTGPAGSGKTYLLNKYIKFLRDNNVEVGITASTGLAATHMGGVTIHAWSGLGIRNELTEYDLDKLEERQYLWRRFEKVKVLIIDEVSMLHHYRLDLVDRVLRHFKRNEKPFGGIQVVLCGDFFQLPPVVRAGEPKAQFAYNSEAWKSLDLRICYLEEQHRQTDKDFIGVLNAIREARVNEETLNLLRNCYGKKSKCDIEPTRLHTHNENVDTINAAELKKITGDTYTYKMSDKGAERLVELLEKSCLAPRELHLKVGAKVMFVKNNNEQGFVNGTLGVVESCDHFGPIVRTTTGQIIKVEPATWMIEENGKLKAEIKQYPLRLAWAITVHKSQGMSLDSVEVDLSKSFEKGMGYVALSRVRTLAGLKLLGLNKNALEVSEEILKYDGEMRRISMEQTAEQNQLAVEIKNREQAEFLTKIKSSKKDKVKKKTAAEEIKELLREKKSLKEMAKIRGVKVESILDNLEKIADVEGHASMSHLKKEISSVKFKKIYSAFKDMFSENRDYRLSPIKNKLGSGVTFEEIRLVRLFVK
ncbi:MAG: AAA family ATPase [Minisyncoccia bacterium]